MDYYCDKSWVAKALWLIACQSGTQVYLVTQINASLSLSLKHAHTHTHRFSQHAEDMYAYSGAQDQQNWSEYSVFKKIFSPNTFLIILNWHELFSHEIGMFLTPVFTATYNDRNANVLKVTLLARLLQLFSYSIARPMLRFWGWFRLVLGVYI